MNCKKCGGRVFVDRMFQGSKKKNSQNRESNHIELFCIMCGKRWMLDKTKNRFAECLARQEKELVDAYATSSSR